LDFNSDIYYTLTFIYSQRNQNRRVTFYRIVRLNGVCTPKSIIVKIFFLDLAVLLSLDLAVLLSLDLAVLLSLTSNIIRKCISMCSNVVQSTFGSQAVRKE